MIAYLRGETGDSVVETILTDTARDSYAHVVNLIEVYYHMLRVGSPADAEQSIQDLMDAGVQPRDDMDAVFWKGVASPKAAHSIALGDCFCIALAQRLAAEVVTSDHGEFDPLVPVQLCPIHFIR